MDLYSASIQLWLEISNDNNTSLLFYRRRPRLKFNTPVSIGKFRALFKNKKSLISSVASFSSHESLMEEKQKYIVSPASSRRREESNPHCILHSNHAHRIFGWRAPCPQRLIRPALDLEFMRENICTPAAPWFHYFHPWLECQYHNMAEI